MENKSFFMTFAILLFAIGSMAQDMGRFVDPRDGKNYKTVTIGTQTILAENFAYKPDSGNYWAYDDKPDNVSKYGYLYDWNTAKAIAPVGWHLPSKEEWETLYKYLGNENKAVYIAIMEGGSSGLDAYRSGLRSPIDGAYKDMNQWSGYWSSTMTDDGLVGIFSMYTSIYASSDDIGLVRIGQSSVKFGLSVRLFKDATKSADGTEVEIHEATKDIDGNSYKTITIGNQVWMAENLKVTHYRNGVAIPNITDTKTWANLEHGVYCDYENVPFYGKKFGKLYNWYAVTDSQNIAPIGWHVASFEEWTTLEFYLMENKALFDGSDAGDKTTKALAATTDWTYDESGIIGKDLPTNNYSGFTALPGGGCSIYGFSGRGEVGTWWCGADKKNKNKAHFKIMSNSENGLGYGDVDFDKGTTKFDGMSVRCVKD